MWGLVTVVVLAVAAGAVVWWYRDSVNGWLDIFKGYRTLIVNAFPALLILFTDLVAFAAGFGWDALLSPRAAAYAMLFSNLLNIALRFATNTPVGVKEPEAK